MKVAEIIAARTPEWRKLESDVADFQHNRETRDAARVALFAQRYRAVCADLSLAISMRFPVSTTEYLHQLVADAHTQLYRSQSFRLHHWGRKLLFEVPDRIFHDPCTWISFFVFWGLFLGSLIAGASSDEFGNSMVGETTLRQMEVMYAHPIEKEATGSSRGAMAGFYVFNNAGIGLKCFTSGIFLGIGSLVVLAFNAIFLGTIFGHMLVSPASGNFTNFVTAHGPFELTAVVLSAAAGLRLGWAIIDTNGYTRSESLRRTSSQALEVAGVATILFLLAAGIEGFISPSNLPYFSKALISVCCTLILLLYIVGLGGVRLWSRIREA